MTFDRHQLEALAQRHVLDHLGRCNSKRKATADTLAAVLVADAVRLTSIAAIGQRRARRPQRPYHPHCSARAEEGAMRPTQRDGVEARLGVTDRMITEREVIPLLMA